MGSCFIHKTIDAKKTPDQIRKIFQEMSDRAAYDCGHSYSGSWNMLKGVSFPNTPEFSSQNNACDYVEEHAEKWGNAVCVRFTDKPVTEKLIVTPTVNGTPVKYSGTLIHVETDWKTHVQPQGLKETYHPIDQLTEEEKTEALRLFTEFRDAEKNDVWVNSMNHSWRPTEEQRTESFQRRMKADAAWRAFSTPIIQRVWKTRKSRKTVKGWLIGGWAAE